MSRSLSVVTPQQLNTMTALQSMLVVSDDQAVRTGLLNSPTVLALNQYQQALGQEYDRVIVDQRAGFRAQIIYALTGCVKHCGELCIMFDEAQLAKDNNSGLAIHTGISLSYPHVNTDYPSYLFTILSAQPAWQQALNAPTTHHQLGNEPEQKTLVKQQTLASGQQNEVLDSLLKHVNDASSLQLITAKRGRGKSYLLSQLIQQLPAITSAPCYYLLSNKHQLTQLDKQIKKDDSVTHVTLITPDNVDAYNPQGNSIIIVDEAATFPIPVLSNAIDNHTHVILASTSDGYEGSASGLMHYLGRFPHCTIHTLEYAYRFITPCPLENIWYILDANRPASHRPTVALDDGHYHLTDTLLHKPQLLSALYQLLCSAHYQTRPDDLQRITDCPNTHTFISVKQQSIVGVVTAFSENLADMSERLKTDILSGKRRVQGHLSIQQLAHTYNQTHWLDLPTLRINRIATAKKHRRQNVASSLLNYIGNWANEPKIHRLTTSFALRDDIQQFWQHNGFDIMRMGTRESTNSGVQNVIMVKHINRSNSNMNTPQSLIMMQLAYATGKTLDETLSWDMAEAFITQYLNGTRHLDHVEFILAHLPHTILQSAPILQARYNEKMPFKQLKQRFSLHGKKDLDHIIKQTFRELNKKPSDYEVTPLSWTHF